MDTIVMRAVFRNKPPVAERLEVEGGLEAIIKMLAPDSQIEISSGQGSFWIAVAAAVAPIASWFAIQTASWAFKKYILDGKVAKTLNGANSNSSPSEQKPVPESGIDDDKDGQLVPAHSGPLTEFDTRVLQAIVDFLRDAEPIGLNQITFKQLRTNLDSGTGVQGKICHLTLSEDAKWHVEFLQVDTRDDFFAS